MKKNKILSPFLKWVGGKRQLLPEIDKHIPKKFSTYYEPFIGGGAVLFHLQPKKAIINDYNEELTNTYLTIKNDIEELILNLRNHKNNSEYFYKIRALDRDENFTLMSKVERAARVIYLNKTCYNGLYRVNSSGEFNSPYGKYKNPNIVNEVTLRAVSEYLNNNDIQIKSGDFHESLKGIRRGAFVYFDSPYDPVSSSSNFTGYIKGGFNYDEQVRLKNVCDDLNSKGIKFLLSNSATPFIKKLYSKYNTSIVKANRFINSNAQKRGSIDEVLVKNYE